MSRCRFPPSRCLHLVPCRSRMPVSNQSHESTHIGIYSRRHPRSSHPWSQHKCFRILSLLNSPGRPAPRRAGSSRSAVSRSCRRGWLRGSGASRPPGSPGIRSPLHRFQQREKEQDRDTGRETVLELHTYRIQEAMSNPSGSVIWIEIMELVIERHRLVTCSCRV
jgi:hypothetical protein